MDSHISVQYLYTVINVTSTLDGKIPEYCVKQLYDELKLYGFKTSEWIIKKGIFSYEGHWCGICNVENYSGIEIVNKKNPSVKFSGWIDWVHIKPCSSENVKDSDKLLFYWESINGDQKTAKEYGVKTISRIGTIPRFILDKFGVIYR